MHRVISVVSVMSLVNVSPCLVTIYNKSEITGQIISRPIVPKRNNGNMSE